jgi:hypothetical protein
MTTPFGVKGTKGSDCTPAIGQIARVCMGKRDGVGAKVEHRACKNCCEILSKLGAVVVEEGGDMLKVVGKQLWRPRCKATCGKIGKFMRIYDTSAYYW